MVKTWLQATLQTSVETQPFEQRKKTNGGLDVSAREFGIVNRQRETHISMASESTTVFRYKFSGWQGIRATYDHPKSLEAVDLPMQLRQTNPGEEKSSN
jgi:hypothetical protein